MGLSGVFLLIALLLALIAAWLAWAGERPLLNFVEYRSGPGAARINRHAAARLLLPVCVNLGCAAIASARPALALPLLFLTPLSILAAVVWIAAGIHRLNVHSP
jgi:hypothetical protein